MSPIVSFHDDKMNHCIIKTQQDGTFEIYMYTSSTLFQTYFQLLAILTLNFHQVIKIEAHKKTHAVYQINDAQIWSQQLAKKPANKHFHRYPFSRLESSFI